MNQSLVKRWRRSLRSTASLAVAATVLIGVGVGARSYAQSPDGSVDNGITISQFQTGGCWPEDEYPVCHEDPKDEFVELHNAGTQPIRVTGWKVQYISASGLTATTLIELTGNVTAQGYVLLGHRFYYSGADSSIGSDTGTGKLAKTGGYLRLLDAAGQTMDLVGWGSVTAYPDWPVVGAPKPGQAAMRSVGTGNTATYVLANYPSNPRGGNLVADIIAPPVDTPPVGPTPTEPPLPEPVITDPPITTNPDEPAVPPLEPVVPQPEPPTPDPTVPVNPDPGENVSPPTEPTPVTPTTPSPEGPDCDGIVITEVVPNPSGTDTDHEYIELHNPGSTSRTLTGCKLQSAASTRMYNLDTVQLAPGEYRALYDTSTGLTLTNTGGTVWLWAAATEVSSATYQKTMADDEAWILLNGTWQSSSHPTPNAPNISNEPAVTETPAPAAPLETPTTDSPDADYAPCKTGQERNPETNRCRTIVTAAALTSCPAGQERNPETNRCRSTSTPASTLTPCATGEVRNLETNRCRSVTTAAASLAVCKPGQVRNPETNRCKAAGEAATTQKPCAAGQVRNPETNRCKKSIAGGSGGTVKDVRSGTASGDNSRWVLAFVALLIALGYAAYEWRQEIRQKLPGWLKRLRRPAIPNVRSFRPVRKISVQQL